MLKLVKVKFAWYDLWIGAFIDLKVKGQITIYICPLPTLLFVFLWHRHAWTYTAEAGVVCTICRDSYRKGK